MFDLRPISHDSIPRALAKAERYRLLNEPHEAQSICRDVLAFDPSNSAAQICLILALTDRFGRPGAKPDEPRALAAALADPYHRAYYQGVVEERFAKALIEAGHPSTSIYTQVMTAMRHFDAAHRIARPGNDDAILRWNACIRLIERAGLAPEDQSHAHDESFDDDVPVR